MVPPRLEPGKIEPMNHATLEHFRSIAAAMQNEPTDWQWTGHYMSQRMFGITETRAKAFQKMYGGIAKKMEA